MSGQMFYDRCIKFPAAADDDSVWSSAVIRVVSLLGSYVCVE